MLPHFLINGISLLAPDKLFKMMKLAYFSPTSEETQDASI